MSKKNYIQKIVGPKIFVAQIFLAKMILCPKSLGLLGYIEDTLEKTSRHADTPFRHPLENLHSCTDTFQTPSRHLLVTHQAPSRHQIKLEICEVFPSGKRLRWSGGLLDAEHMSWFRQIIIPLSGFILQDSQLSLESKMEPSVAIFLPSNMHFCYH